MLRRQVALARGVRLFSVSATFPKRPHSALLARQIPRLPRAEAFDMRLVGACSQSSSDPGSIRSVKRMLKT